MPADQQRATVLIVEDDPGVAILQRRRLERAGFSVVGATDVDGALAALARGGVDLVLLDYRLGESTGLDLHRRMKASGHAVPVILVSGAMEDSAIVEALRAGIRDVIVKTTDYLDSLPETVRGVLAQGNAATSASSPGSSKYILVVEDDPGTAALEKRRLERAGYAVQVATTADEAIDAVRRGDVALAVLDLRLPGGRSGLEVYSQWLDEGFRVPAILVTGFPDQEVAIRALRVGIRDFVPKSAEFVDYLPTAVERVMSEIQVERKLAESELRLATVIGTTLDAILMCEASGRIVLANEAAQQLFGVPPAEMGNLTVTTLIPALSLTTEAVPGHFRLRQELEAVHAATGSSVPIEVAVSDVVIHEARFFTVSARDITERRHVEEERREADRRKDEFLGMLGHELRNPLAAIMSAGEVLHRRLEDPQLQKTVGVVRRQTRALARMVDDLLDVSRVTLGKIELRREPLLLCTAVARVIEGFGDAIRRAELSLVTDVADQTLWVDADPTRLEQVIANLLTNAIKFTPPGGEVRLACSRDGDEAVVTVSDNGIGMPDTLVPRVFDLFVQGDRSLDRSRSGLGIGLSLVHRIVAMHEGTITASSEGPGRGSTFTVRLPLAPQATAAPEGEGGSAQEAGPSLRVLVVDDQRDIADMITVLVEGLGHAVSTAYDAETALALARQDPLDVIIADLGMPEVSGYELAERVRREPGLKHLRLVALTGYGRSEDQVRVAAAGFDVHLTKPVTEGTLQAALAGSPAAT